MGIYVAVTYERAEHNHILFTERAICSGQSMCDAMIVTTPDALHYVPTMKALAGGYHVLLEKSMSQTEKECHDILVMSRKIGKKMKIKL